MLDSSFLKDVTTCCFRCFRVFFVLLIVEREKKKLDETKGRMKKKIPTKPKLEYLTLWCPMREADRAPTNRL